MRISPPILLLIVAVAAITITALVWSSRGNGLAPHGGNQPAAATKSTPIGQTVPGASAGSAAATPAGQAGETAATTTPSAQAASGVPAVPAEGGSASAVSPAPTVVEPKSAALPGPDLPAPDAQAIAAQASLEEAVRTGKYPERLSAMAEPAPFSLEGFLKDPQAYCNIIEPGRAFQTATPAEGVPEIGALVPLMHELPRRELLELRVQAPAGMPVTFRSIDSGAFVQTRLSTATVVAGEDGVARVQFYATPDCTGRTRIAAASPVASGRVDITVMVSGG